MDVVEYRKRERGGGAEFRTYRFTYVWHNDRFSIEHSRKFEFHAMFVITGNNISLKPSVTIITSKGRMLIM